MEPDQLKAAKITIEFSLSQFRNELQNLTPKVGVARSHYENGRNTNFKPALVKGVSGIQIIRENISALEEELKKINQLLGIEGNETSSMSF
ncbi:MAG: hypothetical protein LCH30_03875 [Proteobacteria bacterium]|nr:hypothetical protein [Pseudomonadota bacterium]